jgi:hypothetical protein
MKYIFIGDGLGVPGLPHEISAEEAERLGVGKLLADAIENGSYAPVLSDDGGQKPVDGEMEVERPSAALRAKKK